MLASFNRVGRGSLSEYDSLGRVVKSFQLVPGTGSYASRLVKDAAGNALYSQTRYDDLGRAVASRDTEGHWSYTSYDDAGNVLASKDPLGHVSSSAYDELNRAFQSTDAKGHTTTSSFDNAGRQYKTTFADGTSTSTVYDELNRAVGVTDQLNKTRTMHYDALARMDWIEMPVSSGQVLRTRFGFNELGQKTWQQDARGVGEDAASSLNVNVAAPQSRVTRFGYDVRGRLVQRVMPGQFNGGALAENMAYNELGQLVRKRDFRGYWTSFDYDGRGRLVLKSPDPALQEAGVSFSYPDEFTTTMQRGNALTTSHQDPDRGWMSGIETQAPAPTGTGTTLSTLSFSHDAFGRTQSQTLQSGLGTNLSSRTTSFGYDGLDRLQSITSDDSQTWGYDYDEVGNKTTLTRPGGTQTGYAYDSLNRLTALATRKGAALVSRFDYHLRADGKRDGLSEQVVQPDGTTTQRSVAYAFDLANRLTGESGTDGAGRSYSKSYSLDSAGNRLASSYTLDNQLQAQTSYSYNSLDWLTNTSVQSQSGTNQASYGYDANGAQISQTSASGTSAQTWDFEGNLRAQGVVDAEGNWNGARTSYAYDASGMRLTQATANAMGVVTDATSYVWDGDRVAEERDASGVLQGVYEHGQELGPLRLRRLKNGAWQNRFFVGDGQDSTRQLMNEAGVVTDSYFYDSFGNALNGGQGVTNNAFKYTGQQQDSSGLYYLRARYYNSGTGRFLSQDPEMGNADDPVSMHRYLYAGDDPANGVDPSGRETLGGLMMSVGISTQLRTSVSNAEVNIYERVAGVFGYDASKEGMEAYFINKYTGTNLTGGDIKLITDSVMMFKSVKITRGTAAGGDGGFGGGGGRGGVGSGGGSAMGGDGKRISLMKPMAAQRAINRYSINFGKALRVAEDFEEEKGNSQCFVAGTHVVMANGSHTFIEKIQVGDKVLSRDEKTGKTVSKKVVRLFQHQAPATLVLHFKNGEKVETTQGHRFYVESKGFVKAGELGIGTSIVTRAGPAVELVKVELKNRPATVYNFEVEDFHTYFVSNDELWVHNVCEYEIGTFHDLRKDYADDKNPNKMLLQMHHLPQAHPAAQVIVGYIREYGTAIAMDPTEHGKLTKYNIKGTYVGSASQIIDIGVANMLAEGVPRANVDNIEEFAYNTYT